ncbi:plasmid pRiA4b ORF-3 family protein [Arthrobacter sp. I2-34]|uniref:Plasmid pRiA4b ORF-3 family protein n=1 Tax=Arthrobacter hankyongi TaxID=2904801 RepID=A0ABS9L3Y2_9MICC|nr:plasmid pRiA4b ORF-3 family protein [Arthrobacter hankyongi]MCG2621390.1 plasmid pRiA4b ORF-3 family protein [Arthrobacter hankyongi]
MNDYRVARAIEALTPDFVRWFEEDIGPAEDALTCLGLVQAISVDYQEEAGTTDVTAFQAGLLADMFQQIDDVDPGMVDVVVEMFHLYIDFLHETGRWTGTDEDYEEVHAFLLGQAGPGLPVIEIPQLDDEREVQGFAALPLIAHARALLDWIGAGRPVTSTGVLQLKDIEAAAASIGVAARGIRKRSAEVLDAAGDTILAQSMREVPLLYPLWTALEAAGILEVRSTKVVPGEGARRFLAGSPAEQLEQCRYVTTWFLRQAVHARGLIEAWDQAAATVLVSVIVAAASPEPPLLDRVLHLADNVPEEERTVAMLATLMLPGQLEELAGLGLLVLDDHVRVPAVVIQCVAGAFEDEFDLDVTYPDSTGQRAAAAPSSVFQLKIMLKGSKPPVWRRVLVGSNMRLGTLHQVIQLVFGWEDYHLHSFRTGGWPGTEYGPAGQERLLGEPPVNEDRVPIGEVLTGEGGKLAYTYDFGDDWEHIITLEKILAPDGGPLPRCTGGRGAAPAEDSGGVWGWMDLVEAVNNPADERHEELREWLGLAPGETLDPKKFAVEETDAALDALR